MAQDPRRQGGLPLPTVQTLHSAEKGERTLRLDSREQTIEPESEDVVCQSIMTSKAGHHLQPDSPGTGTGTGTQDRRALGGCVRCFHAGRLRKPRESVRLMDEQ